MAIEISGRRSTVVDSPVARTVRRPWSACRGDAGACAGKQRRAGNHELSIII